MWKAIVYATPRKKKPKKRKKLKARKKPVDYYRTFEAPTYLKLLMKLHNHYSESGARPFRMLMYKCLVEY